MISALPDYAKESLIPNRVSGPNADLRSVLNSLEDESTGPIMVEISFQYANKITLA